MELKKIKSKKQKRLGRGYGSGKGGHTSSRGQKGQKTRGRINILFEGLKVKKSFVKKLPLLRGKGRLKAGKKPRIIYLDQLNIFTDGSRVDYKALIRKGLITQSDCREYGIKILRRGALSKSLTISLPISSSAIKEVEKLKGKIEVVNKE